MNDKIASLILKIKTEGEEQLDNITGMFGKLAAAAAVAFAAISAVIVKSIDEYSQQEQAINSLNRAMVNSGTFSVELRDAYLEQAEALSKLTLFGDEQIVQAQSAYTQMTNGMKLTKEATIAILDFAQAKGMDAASAAEIFAKSVATSTNALGRHGIEVNSSMTAQQKLDSVVTQVTKKFGGQAEAATEGLGSIKMLQKSFGEMFETIGSKLAPAVTILANRFNAFFNDGSAVITVADLINRAFLFTVTLSDRIVTSFNKIAMAVGGIFSSMGAAIDKFRETDTVALGLLKGMNELVEGYKNIGKANKELEDQYETRNTEMYTASLGKQLESLKDAREKERALELAHYNQKLAGQKKFLDEKTQKDKDQEQIELEAKTLKAEADLAMDLAILSGRESEIQAAKIRSAETKFKIASLHEDDMTKLKQTQAEKNAALAEKHKAQDLLREAKLAEAKEAMLKDSLGKIATLSRSGNHTLAAIGKAAAITQIAIDTPAAIAKAWTLGPIIGPPAAVLVGAAMAAQAAQVAGVQLADGGVVMPRPGGTQATIGEAGQAEAVIPLDRMNEFGFGGGGNSINIVVNGGLMGSETDARQFALAIDKELLKLRRNNESVSFDSGVI
jgi:hypothetical protein